MPARAAPPVHSAISASTIMSPAAGRRRLLAIVALQIALLGIGIGRDYRLKHEDNNALHATFARSHAQLGLGVTRGQNYFHSPASGSGDFYVRHPPGPGLALAAVYSLTGRDGPAVTRATAVAFHVLATFLFFGLARRIFGRGEDALLATLAFVLFPESAFYGRMVNHETLGLPAAILLVRGCWESLQAGSDARRWQAVCAAACLWSALAGWGGFFVIAACALYAAREGFVRGNARARPLFALLTALGVLLFAMVAGHLLWASGRGVGHLVEMLAERTSVAGDLGVDWTVGKIFETHWRYFGLTSMAALAALGCRGLRGRRASPPVEVGSVFLIAGVGYVAAFSLNAAQHAYWQFFLLPAAAIAVTLAWRWLAAGLGQPARRRACLALSVFAAVEFTAVVGVTMARRHIRPEPYCIEAVAQLRRDAL